MSTAQRKRLRRRIAYYRQRGASVQEATELAYKSLRYDERKREPRLTGGIEHDLEREILTV